MTESIYDALTSLSVFVLPILAVAIAEQRKAEKERKKRDQELLLDYKIAMACEQAVEADRLARKSSAQQTLASREPIKFADEVPTRTPRKWGRHAN
ncbi:hypothetical protein [Streptococcus suis]|uniref:Uncharacterized protein n=2 Tax=Streptococcus suis TaxID=1307 RepID=A0A0Z8ML70_STRSU|nr:hypothetical protein [Streptococcus suis]AND00358.1 hypothetical protein A6M16_07625 [Streptococcus suis]AOM75078.1 hypothetical protein BFP66_07525 [Streptococcus suis]MBL6515854.1 hypothetical protein [Streptococcus suis]MBS8058977.1 hypothetical protein [Streptococcus suis]MBS8114431.1 hypothetical protein [Streptococcus suis]